MSQWEGKGRGKEMQGREKEVIQWDGKGSEGAAGGMERNGRGDSWGKKKSYMLVFLSFLFLFLSAKKTLYSLSSFVSLLYLVSFLLKTPYFFPSVVSLAQFTFS